jgi:superfamily I DNA and/or RNA helicase
LAIYSDSVLSRFAPSVAFDGSVEKIIVYSKLIPFFSYSDPFVLFAMLSEFLENRFQKGLFKQMVEAIRKFSSNSHLLFGFIFQFADVSKLPKNLNDRRAAIENLIHPL